MLYRLAFSAVLLLSACDTSRITLTPDWFVDSADLLAAQEEHELIEVLSTFYEHTQVELVGVIISDLDGEPIESYTTTLFDDWDLGSRQTNNGIMVVLAIKERQVHVVRGLGMAWQLSQTVVDSIVTTMASDFREARYFSGFKSGFSRIMEVAGAVPWNVDYSTFEDILEDADRAVGRIVAVDALLTGFDDDNVIITGSDGNSAVLRVPVNVNVPPLSIDNLLGVHARVLRVAPLELVALGLEVDDPL